MKFATPLFVLYLASAFAGSAQNITTIVGNGTASFSGDGGSASAATVNAAPDVATDLYGNLYIADQNNHRIRKVDSKGIITTVAGTGTPGFSGDGGPATKAELNTPTGVCTDAAGDLFIADLSNLRIRKVDTSGKITTVAGNGTQASNGDGGPAIKASMYIPIRCVVDSAGNLYIADQGAHKIRKIDSSGTISTFAGTGNDLGIVADFSGDGGPAIDADLNNPTAVAIDPSGIIYIADQYNQRIRKVDKSGIITSVTGTGTSGWTGDGGPAVSAEVSYPGGMAIDQNGDIYFSDCGNFRIRKISNGTITTVAGDGTEGFAGDNGPALQAEFNNQFGIALDSAGNLYIADLTNNRIRKIGDLGAAVVPKFTTASVTNGASFQSGISAGALITIFGTNLSNNVHGIAAFHQVPLPTTLGGSRVLIGGTAIPLFDVINLAGTEQISAQAPFEIAGEQTVDVVIDNGRAQSTTVQLTVSEAQPGIFLPDGVNGAFLHTDFSLVTAANPAAPGELILLYCTGLGAVTPPSTTGALASGTTLSKTNITPTLTVGGTSASIEFSGLAPDLVGLYQINFTVPMGTSSGSVDVVVVANAVSSNIAKLPVQ
jgi:uncharacterized protein (TIGR03437 family)